MARKEEYERIGRERAEAEREARRETWRDLARTLLAVVGWCGLGLAIMFFAWYVNDRVLGKAFLWGGMGVGYAGMAYTLLAAYRRGERRGDW